MGKILIIDEEFNQHKIEREILERELEDTEIIELGYSKEEIIKQREGVIGILVQIDFAVDKKFMEQFPTLRAVSVYGGGYNNIDVNSATALGIKVSRSPNYCNHEVSEYVIAMILNFSKKLTYLNERAKQGFWGARAISSIPIDEWSIEEMDILPQRVYESTLFIIGYGKIGKLVGKKATALGMRVVYYDPNVLTTSNGEERVTLEDGLKSADFIAITASLNSSSISLLNSKNFPYIKKTAYIINAARGKIIEENALINALKAGNLRGAALDVFSSEPLNIDSPLLKMNNLFVTPHSVYISDQSIRDLKHLATNNLISMLSNRKPEGCVNC
ncbi:MAG: NAD(P)-dependent oxidoreductase [Thermoplasmata archaeon]